VFQTHPSLPRVFRMTDFVPGHGRAFHQRPAQRPMLAIMNPDALSSTVPRKPEGVRTKKKNPRSAQVSILTNFPLPCAPFDDDDYAPNSMMACVCAAHQDYSARSEHVCTSSTWRVHAAQLACCLAPDSEQLKFYSEQSKAAAHHTT
jgi:hypothetical protein